MRLGCPIKKPWKVVTSSPDIAMAFFEFSFSKWFNHSLAAGSKTARTAFFPEGMWRATARTLYPESRPVVPAMPVQVSQHREREQQLQHVSPLSISSVEDIDVAVESCERCRNILEEVF